MSGTSLVKRGTGDMVQSWYNKYSCEITVKLNVFGAAQPNFLADAATSLIKGFLLERGVKLELRRITRRSVSHRYCVTQGAMAFKKRGKEHYQSIRRMSSTRVSFKLTQPILLARALKTRARLVKWLLTVGQPGNAQLSLRFTMPLELTAFDKRLGSDRRGKSSALADAVVLSKVGVADTATKQ